MNTSITKVLFVLLAVATCVQTVQAQDDLDDVERKKLGQTGFKFLQVQTDPRTAALAGAVTSFDQVGAAALFANPASMAWLESQFQVTAGQTQWIADVNYNQAALAFSPASGRYGVFGVSLTTVDYGEFLGTVYDASDPRGYKDFSELGLANPTVSALALGIGYAKALTDRFSVGGQVKYAMQDLGAAPSNREGDQILLDEFSKSTPAFDFGVLYKTGFRSLNFAMSARNFSPEVTYVQDNFELPLTFRIGVSMDLMDLTSIESDDHSFLLTLDAERPRDFAEHFRIGGEYTFLNTVALRAGYQYPTDERGVSLGAGLQHEFGGIGFGFDYAYTTFGVFDAVNQLALRVSF